MKKFTLVSLLLVLSVLLSAQTVIQSSFDDYTLGDLSGQNSWSMDESGFAQVLNQSTYTHTGTQGIKLGSTSTSSVELNHTAYDKNTTGLSGVVYVDFWLKIITPASEEEIKIAIYDLMPSGSRRACEFLIKSDGRFYVSGSSKSDDLSSSYDLSNWTRFSAKIDYATCTFEAAINGDVISYENDEDEIVTAFEFRENYSAVDKGRDIEVKEYHSLRFAYDDDVCDIAIDDIYVGSTIIDDIAFAAPATSFTIAVDQPENATITLTPNQSTYNLGDTITARIDNIDTHYTFQKWSGSFAGTDNPLTIVMQSNLTLGANIVVDQTDPLTDYTITLNQSTGGTLTVSPSEGPYYEGTSVTFTASQDIGYNFDSWTGISGTSSTETVEISDHLDVTANFTEGLYTGRTLTVSSASQLEEALEDMLPGDEIILADGTYNNINVSLKALGGSASTPVTVRAQNQGQATITGSGQFSLTNCAHITFSGLNFDVAVYTLFKLTGCNNIRITKNTFKNTGNGGSKLILIGDGWDNTSCISHHNRIDHNLFDGKTDKGAWLVIDGSHGGTPQVSQYDTIDHNHFRNNSPRMTNEKETIRIGMSDLSLSSAFCTVEQNLFEACDGDPEIISVKSCDNFIRNNTFKQCLGTVSLRHGDRTEVSGNYFLGQEKTAQFTNDDNETSTIGCGGVRVYGKDHKIFNNYFEGLTGSTWDAACTLTCGDALNTNVTNSSDLTKHYVIENLEFTHNTLINNASDIEIGYRDDWGKAPINCLIANNIIVQDANPVTTIKTAGKASGLTFADNIIYTTGTGSWGDITFTDAQASNSDPLLELSDARTPESNPMPTYKLSINSPAIDASTTNTFAYITTDNEGQPLSGARDLGADEYNGTGTITNGLLDSTHVGPYAIVFSETTPSGIASICQTTLSVYPNPCKTSTTITLEGHSHLDIYKLTGQLIHSVDIQDTYEWQSSITGLFLLITSDIHGEQHATKLLVE